MNITEDIVKQLLNTLVTPEFEGDIVGYDIILRQNDEGKTGIGVDVLMPHSMTWDKSLEYSIERRIRNVMGYLSPSFTMVEFYNVTNY
jgi:predicted thioesterase